MTVNVNIPTSYEEMNEQQLRYAVSLMAVNLPEQTILTRCFLRFAGIRLLVRVGDKQWIKHNKKITCIHTATILYGANKMDFLLKNQIMVTPFSKIGKLQPCEPQMQDTTFLQYINAENYYQAYLHTQDETYLLQLLATLYQHPNSKRNTKEYKTSYLQRKVTKQDKTMVILWYASTKNYFANKWQDWFERADSNSKQAPDMHAIIQNQLRILNNGDITKNSDIFESPTWEALDELNAKAAEYRKLIRKTK